MPDQSANAATARADGYIPRLYLSVMDGSVIATCEVDTTPADGATELEVTVLTGAIFATAFSGMRVVVSTPGGAHKGTISVGYGALATANTLPIRELSPGEVPIEAGDILTIYDDIPPVDMLPAANLTFAPDHETYIDQNELYAPFANSGGAWVGKLDASGNADVPFLGSTSFLVDPDSSTPVTHVWTGTGSPSFVVGNSLSADPTLRWTSAGKKLVRHIVTDEDNNKTASQWIQVHIHDENDPPFDLVLAQPPTSTPEQGFSFSFTLFDNPSLADLRDGAHVILWSDDTLPGGASPFGSKVAGRSHIVAEGYVRRDEGTLGDGVNGVTFEVISPIARLAELPGFSKVFIRDQTPAAWNEYKSLTIKRAIIALLRVYTNISQIHDLIFDAFEDADYPLMYIQKQNPYEQVLAECKGRQARLTCDRAGRLEVQGELWAVDLDDRTAVTKTFTFTDEDRLAGSLLRREHVRPLETFKLRGFVAGTAATTEEGTTAPVFARYPATPARGGQVIIEERHIVDDASSDLFRRCSLSAAWVNADYFDADDRSAAWQHAPELTCKHPLVYARMFQNYREYVAHDGTAVDEYGRQVDLSGFLWIPGQVTEDYASLTCQVVYRAATYAPAFMSADDTPPEGEILPPWTPPVIPPITVPPTEVDPIPAWTGELPINGIVLSYAESKCARMDSFNPGTGVISYTDISTGFSSGTGISYRSDPHRYRRGFALMTDGLYRCDDIETFTTWTLIADNDDMFGDSSRRGYKLLMDHKRQGWIMVLSGNSGAAVSFNYGLTWTQVAIDGGGSPSWGTSAARGGDAAICGHDANHVYSVVQHPSDVWKHRLYRSEDGGLTWTTVNANAPDNGGGLISTLCIEIPYARADGSANLDDSSMEIFAVSKSSGSQSSLSRSTNRGASFSSLIGTSGNTYPTQSVTGEPFTCFTHDSSYWYHTLNTSTLGNVAIRRTTDQFASNSTVLDVGNGTTFTVMLNGWSMNPDAAIAFSTTSFNLKLTLDGGSNWFGSKPAGWADGIAYAEFGLWTQQG